MSNFIISDPWSSFKLFRVDEVALPGELRLEYKTEAFNFLKRRVFAMNFKGEPYVQF